MKILAIRLKNLASVEGVFEVDFTSEPLLSAGIFAISGPTGAGKSTILDALCLALYDKTPRFVATAESLYLSDVGENQINQSDVRNVLRRGTGEGYSEVDFLGVTGRCYRSRWTVRRARSRATGSLQPQTLQVFDLDKEEELQGTKTELLARLTGLIGLTYEQFTRTVLLAQNDFATFLKSRESAKAELLEKLTGTEIYSRISREIYVRSKAADEAESLLKNSMALIELVPEEELDNLHKERKRLVELRTSGNKRLEELNAKLLVVRSLKVQQELLSKKCKEELSENETLKIFTGELAVQTESLARFKEKWNALQPELNKARELDVRLQTLQHHYKQSEQTLQSIHKQTTSLEKKCGVEKEALHAVSISLSELLQQDVQTTADGLPDLAEIEQIMFREAKELSALQKENDDQVVRLNAFNIQTVSEERDKLSQRLSALQQALQASLLVVQLQERQTVLEAELTISVQQLAGKEEQLVGLQRLFENARITMSKSVQALRQELHDGEACPVCGSLSHPYRLENKLADTLYHSIEKEYKTAADDYKQANDRLIALQRDVRNLTEQRQIQEKILSVYPETERNSGFIQKMLTELQLGIGKQEEKIKLYQTLYSAWQQLDNEIRKKRNYQENLREEFVRIKMLMQQVTATNEQYRMARQTEDSEQARFKSLQDEFRQLQQERAALLKGKPVEEAENSVRRKEQELNIMLEGSRKKVETANMRISLLQGELKQLTQAVHELSDQQEQIENPDQLSETIAFCQTTNRETERNLSVIEAKLLQQEQNRNQLKKLETELKEKQMVAGKWGKLNKLIGSADGAKFKIIAQSYTLNLLLMHANKHLSYLSKRYKLQQVLGTLALQVVDCDMCDEIRTVYSLSGGESFLVSLALALGLSSLSSNNLKVESLFIDEGFGSLDAESLRAAMEALEQLQMQGRKIGVISHVQEMCERISVQVQLRKKVNGKSEIVVTSM